MPAARCGIILLAPAPASAGILTILKNIGEKTVEMIPGLYGHADGMNIDHGWLGIVWLITFALLIVSAIAGFLMMTFQRRLRREVHAATAELLAKNAALLSEIDRRTTVEKTLINSRNLYQTLVDKLPQSVFLKNLESKYLSVNKSYAAMIGCVPDEVVGKSDQDFFPVELAAKYRADDRGVMSSGATVTLQEEIDIDGERRWINTVKTPIRTDKGDVYGVLGIFWDITEQREAQERLRAEERRDRALLQVTQTMDTTVAAILDRALDLAVGLSASKIGYIYFYNEVSKNFMLYSWSRNVMPQCTLTERQTVYELEKTGLWGEAIRQRKPIVTNDYAAPNGLKRGMPAGHVALTRHMNLPIFDEGKIVAVVGMGNKETHYTEADVRHLQVFMDGVWKVVKRLEAENRLRELNQDLEHTIDQRSGELKAAHAELEKFFSVTLDLLCIADTGGRFIRLNRAWQTILGYPLSYLQGKPFLDFVHPDDVQATFNALTELSKGMEVINFVNRYRCSDGSYRWIEWHSSPVGNKVFAAARDITRHIEIEQELQNATEAAEQANRAKSAFLANMSHEIRTPLNAVIGYSELLEKLVADDTKRGYVEAIAAAGKSLLRLINDILDISKIEADRIELRPAPTNLKEMIEEIRQIFTLKLSEQGAAMTVAVAPEVSDYILIDESRLRQILLNIVGNAVKFTTNGSITVSAAIEHGADDRDLVIIVEDTGCGIPADQKDAIFEPFRQVMGQSATFGGSGLGLAICKKLIERMAGTITLRSEPGKGSAFTIRLPHIASVAVVGQPDTVVAHPPPDFAGRTILVVDDIESNCAMISALLTETGCTALVAKDGKSGIRTAQEVIPDLILMDIRMPGMDGFEAAAILKSDPATAAIPIVAITASVLHTGSEHDHNPAGCFNGILFKPITRTVVLAELARHVSPGSVRAVTSQNVSDSVRGNHDTRIEAGSLPQEVCRRAHDLQGAVKFQEIRDFAQELTIIAEQTGSSACRQVAQALHAAAGTFDIARIRHILSAIPTSADFPIDTVGTENIVL
jgi:PAS domain S-box-containing protein